ncbi:MAG: hypothetical protein SCM96_08115 [Acidobacteriota bacterium]|nr:hypothetical protein [Acidobacteriota bacterium]
MVDFLFITLWQRNQYRATFLLWLLEIVDFIADRKQSFKKHAFLILNLMISTPSSSQSRRGEGS